MIEANKGFDRNSTAVSPIYMEKDYTDLESALADFEAPKPARVYLATPYSHKDADVMHQRFMAATRITAHLVNSGHVVFSPITHSHLLAEHYDMPTDWDFWKEQDIPYVEWADVVVVVTADGWRKSTGVQEETNYALQRVLDDCHGVFLYDPIVTPATEIVGISGKKRTGKDYMADRLVEDYGFEKYSLADTLKEAAQAIFDFSDEQLWGELKSENDLYWDVTPREILQQMGTNFFRGSLGADIWLHALKKKLQRDLPPKVVIPDIRFPNEVKTVQDWGGYVVRIDASERLEQDDDHASETALDGYQGYNDVLYNNGTLEEFDQSIAGFMDFINNFEPNGS